MFKEKVSMIFNIEIMLNFFYLLDNKYIKINEKNMYMCEFVYVFCIYFFVF